MRRLPNGDMRRKRRRRQRGDRNLPGPGSATGITPPGLWSATATDGHDMLHYPGRGGMNPGPKTGREVSTPGRQGRHARRVTNPARGSADLIGTPSAVFSLTSTRVPFLLVVSRHRRVSRSAAAGAAYWARGKKLMPRGLMQRMIRRAFSPRCGSPAVAPRPGSAWTSRAGRSPHPGHPAEPRRGRRKY